MRTGGRDEFADWRQRARERLGTEPTPADLWDQYISEVDASNTRMRTPALDSGSLDNPAPDRSYRRLEDLKAEAQGIERFFDLFEPPFEDFLMWALDSDYLRQKRTVRQERENVHNQYLEWHRDFKRSYGATLKQLTRVRSERKQPDRDLEHHRTIADAALEDITIFRENKINSEYITGAEFRRLASVHQQCRKAVEYVDQIQRFLGLKENVSPHIRAFEHRYALYADGDRYMIHEDEKHLRETIGRVQRRLNEMIVSLQPGLLPEADEEWLSNQRTQFDDVVEEIDSYNEAFIARQRKKYTGLFETEHGPLNDEQQRAIVANDRSNQVDASAGTGKTLTLTYRFAYLYRQGTSVENIRAVTLTTDASQEMKSRIASTLTEVSESDLEISTFHSLARSIIDRSRVHPINWEDWDQEENRSALVSSFLSGDEAEQYPAEYSEFERHHQLFLAAARKHDNNSHHPPKKRYLEFLERARNFDRSPSDIRADLSESKRVQYHFGMAATSLLSAYLTRAEQDDIPIDYKRILNSATTIVEQNQEAFEDEYQHLLVDEYQDISESAVRLIESLCVGDTRLFVVGDDWQSIYGFRGSDPSIFRNFEKRFGPTEYTQLTLNYRCPPEVVEAGTELMSRPAAEEKGKIVRPWKDRSCPPVLHRLGGLYRPRVPDYTIQLVEEHLEEGDPENVMILSRNDEGSELMNTVAEKLEGAEIPYTRNGEDTGVTVQSIHSAKGTEAEFVVLVNATDGGHGGLPPDNSVNPLIKPAVDSTTDEFAEERRLCYVALTRTERELHVIARDEHVSPFVESIDSHFETIRSIESADAIEGVLTDLHDRGDKHRGTLECQSYEIEFIAWKGNLPSVLSEGNAYRISEFVDRDDDEYPEHIELTPDTSVELLLEGIY
ncbi:hypothetical protein BRC86_08090 [Halobacteriales archaeon QS_3_64_16]|nr:MAG: hypothetical protein BRC86_08090 [Halobacteriales archaeon QS_3_64_16]